MLEYIYNMFILVFINVSAECLRQYSKSSTLYSACIVQHRTIFVKIYRKMKYRGIQLCYLYNNSSRGLSWGNSFTYDSPWRENDKDAPSSASHFTIILTLYDTTQVWIKCLNAIYTFSFFSLILYGADLKFETHNLSSCPTKKFLLLNMAPLLLTWRKAPLINSP